MTRDYLPDEHQELYAKLRFILLGTRDERGRPWSSLLYGPAGFLSCPDARTLHVAAQPYPGDPGAAGLATTQPVGLLGIALTSRRRNRLNGVIRELDDGGFTVGVEQSFGNCPKYIQRRSYLGEFEPNPQRHAHDELLGGQLSPRAQACIARADTFFIATASPHAGEGDPVHGLDVSHRGGTPGFVRQESTAGGMRLTWPDFAGNRVFNTVGNLALLPLAGVLFVDFESGDALSLTGAAHVLFSGPELTAHPGAERLFVFDIHAGFWLEHALPMRWSAPQFAPELP